MRNYTELAQKLAVWAHNEKRETGHVVHIETLRLRRKHGIDKYDFFL